MIVVKFKNLDRSELARELVNQRLEALTERFPDLDRNQIDVTLSMENSPQQAGPDLFTVKVHCRGGLYDKVTLSKSAPNLYAALAEVVEHMVEVLSRHRERRRSRRRLRKAAAEFPEAPWGANPKRGSA